MRPASQSSRPLCRAIPALFLLLVLILPACTPVAPTPGETPDIQAPVSPLAPTRTPFMPLPPTPAQTGSGEVRVTETTASEAATETPLPAVDTQVPTQIPATQAPPGEAGINGFWAAPYLPAELPESVKLPPDFRWVDTPEQASVRLEAGDQNPVSRWVLALVTPFPTIVDGVSARELHNAWEGESGGPFSGEPLLVDESTYALLVAWWGEPAGGATRQLPSGELLDEAWEGRDAWAIVPFDVLSPRWKVLQVEGRSPLWKEFDPRDYALTVPISLQGDPALVSRLLSQLEGGGEDDFDLFQANRDPAKITTVGLTGVTALVRATAFTMNRNGITYPAEDIGNLLREIDITHISNEIPFSPDCPPPNPTQEGLRFCSDPAYIALLEEIGTDIVELTGDHFGDWGPEAMIYTLGMYEERGWPYYGGGYDRKDARQARLVEHNGNRLAFIGCNGKGGGYATASEAQPGAVSCDIDWMHDEISRLTSEGYQVIATFQHFEYYTYNAQPDQIEDFRGMAEAGAVIVSGSQAHQPQGMEFYDGAFIHYGLGNLFFDQYNYCTGNACNDGFINRHVFYGGKYIQTELIPITFVDYARPRLMNAEEKATLLEKVFSASGW